MKHNLIFIALISSLFVAGSFGAYSIFQHGQSAKLKHSTNSPKTSGTTSHEITINDVAPEKVATDTIRGAQQIVLNNDYEQLVIEVTELISQSQYRHALELIDTQYQLLSTNQLEEFEQLFITEALKLWQAKNASEAISLLTRHKQIFSGVEGLRLLSNIHLVMENWQTAINTLLEATSREYQPDKLQDLISNLISAANSQRLLLESQKDELGINTLFKNLYASHPNVARFQYELAASYARLNDIGNARSLLEPLQYDSEYAAIARSALAALDSARVAVVEKPAANTQPTNDVIVPLQRTGNSFVASTSINNRQLRLLLDTGASITALSRETIESLNLKPTGRTIQLSTANGTTQSRLYRIDKIRLGRLTYNGLVVAEIEFGKNSQIHGLLGTDLLNQLDNRYSYVIDNEKNALIFKAKK